MEIFSTICVFYSVTKQRYVYRYLDCTNRPNTAYILDARKTNGTTTQAPTRK